MRLPRFARNDTCLRLPRFARNDTDLRLPHSQVIFYHYWPDLCESKKRNPFLLIDITSSLTT